MWVSFSVDEKLAVAGVFARRDALGMDNSRQCQSDREDNRFQIHPARSFRYRLKSHLSFSWCECRIKYRHNNYKVSNSHSPATGQSEAITHCPDLGIITTHETQPPCPAGSGCFFRPIENNDLFSDIDPEFRMMMRLIFAAGLALVLGACEKRDPAPTTKELTAAAVGELIFHDASLSASGKQSCASCHSPEHAHAQPNALAVQFGGPGMDQTGTRAVPSIRYLTETPPLGFDEEGTPYGGFNHDGSVDTLAAQAERPLLAANEMANLTRAAVVEKLRQASYAAKFRQVFGEKSLDDVDTAFAKLGVALERYQIESPEFHPFSSKYDAYLAGKGTLTAAEMRGLKLFNDEKKGNCAACHPSAQRDNGKPPLFTDFTYDALGVARNAAIPANADPQYADLGLCRSGRTGRASKEDACGKFKVPTLRNVATRQVFFHNGQISSLRESVAFYVRRDTHPQEWYPQAVKKQVEKFNDLPANYRVNVNVEEVPYGGKRGGTPVLNDQEIDDLVAFLKTLTD